MRGVLLGIAAVVVASGVIVPAPAQTITPMVYDLAPAGKDSNRELEFWNSQNRPVAIELTAARRSYDEHGTAIDVPAPADFTIVPQQFIAAAGERKKVRLVYSGSAALHRSATYAVTFRQVPIAAGGSDPKVRLLFEFTTLAHVVPAGAKENVQVAARMAGTTATLTFTNRGSRYARLDAAPLRIRQDGVDLSLDPAELRDTHDLRWILPGETRVATVPVDNSRVSLAAVVESIAALER